MGKEGSIREKREKEGKEGKEGKEFPLNP